MPDEKAERFYSYLPWWSDYDNRTSVFLADVIFNKVFFYVSWDEYPLHFLTSIQDINDTVAVYGNNSMSHHEGSYYIRLRPDFALYDLISDRQYIYNMYAFSMAPSSFD